MAQLAPAGQRPNVVVDTISRCLAALFGNYALTLGIGSLLAVTLVRAGMSRVEAAALASMLAFVVYLLVLIWTVQEARMLRVWIVIGGGALLTNATAHWAASGLGVAR